MRSFLALVSYIRLDPKNSGLEVGWYLVDFMSVALCGRTGYFNTETNLL